MIWTVYLSVGAAGGVIAEFTHWPKVSLAALAALWAAIVRLLQRLLASVPVLGPLTSPHPGRHRAGYVEAYVELGDTQAIPVVGEVTA